MLKSDNAYVDLCLNRLGAASAFERFDPFEYLIRLSSLLVTGTAIGMRQLVRLVDELTVLLL